MRLFWRKTISGNDFTPHCVFGCTRKIKFSRKSFHLTVCFMALTRKLVYISIFTSNHFQVSDAQREREREREERVTDPPKTDLIGLVVTHDRSRRPWPMTDLSLSLNFWSLSLPSSLNLTELWSLTNGVVFIFVFLSLYIEIFYYKICLVAEKMGEKMWESSRKMAFSECNQTHKNIF